MVNIELNRDWRFARGGARVTGVDLAPTAIDLARKNFLLHGVAAEEPSRLLEVDGKAVPAGDVLTTGQRLADGD